ncbi:MAG TPA: metalloregulator ArsR/SmtB family transcription factor [Acidimicrobiales bacterium]
MFHALADSTRRDILSRSMRGENSVSTLATFYPMSFAAVQKHVAILERAELVTKRRQGREQLVRGDLDALHYARQLLQQFETIWQGRVERFGDIVNDNLRKGDS